MPLSDRQRARAARELEIPGFAEGRERLLVTSVRVGGAGPLVETACSSLAQGGVGRVWLDGPASAPPTEAAASLVFLPTVAEALLAAEAVRRAGLPHVVVDPDADGGSVVTVPAGAPCYACGRAHSSARRPPLPAGAAALGFLSAQELLLLLAFPGAAGGRRIELRRGALTTRATSALAGCACSAGASR
jgi:hypothetical protein